MLPHGINAYHRTYRRWLQSRPGNLDEAAESVGQTHLIGGMRFDVEERWAAHQNCHSLCAGDGHVQAVQAVQEVDSAWRFGGARGRHRVDDHGCFLALELVDRAYARALR